MSEFARPQLFVDFNNLLRRGQLREGQVYACLEFSRWPLNIGRTSGKEETNERTTIKAISTLHLELLVPDDDDGGGGGGCGGGDDEAC